MKNEQYKNLSIKCNNLSERAAAICFLERFFGIRSGIGFTYNSYPSNLYVQGGNNGNRLDWIYITVGSQNYPPSITVPFQDLINYKDYFKPQYKEVKLNETHTAKVYKDKIVVGCQEFPVSIISNLERTYTNLLLEQNENK